MALPTELPELPHVTIKPKQTIKLAFKKIRPFASKLATSVCVYGFFMMRMTALVLCARPQDLLMLVPARRVHVASRLLDFRAEESRVLRHVKPLRCGEASRKPRARERVRTQAIGALAHGFYPLGHSSTLAISEAPSAQPPSTLRYQIYM